MPCISSCPACHRDLTVADQASPERRLRCPLCSAEFSAAEILADAVPFPPAAIELEAELAPETMPPEAAATQAASVEPSATPESLEAVAGVSAAAEEEVVEEEAAEEEVVEEQAEAEAEEEAASAKSPAYAVRSAPRKKQQSSLLGMLGTVFGMVFGGALGLAIGYYILLWIGGPRADFLEVRDKLPAWMLPAKRSKGGRIEARRGEAEGRKLADLLEEPDEIAPAPAGLNSTPLDAAPASGAWRDPPPADIVQVGASEALPEEILPNEFAADPREECEPLGPRGFNTYTADDVWKALAAVSETIGCEHCHATGYIDRETPLDARPGAAGESQRTRCPHCHGKPVRGLTAEAFERLCVLADAVTFAQLGGDAADHDQLREQLLAALMRVADDRAKAQIIGRLAGARFDDSQRQTNGIILAGTVQSVAEEGPLCRIQLVLFGVPRTVVVYSPQPPHPDFTPADRVLILGSIVDSPSDNLAGYQGKLTQVVWGGLPLKLAPAGQ